MMKLVECYCRGQVSLYEDKLSDGSKVYFVTVLRSGDICVKSLKAGVALCKAFVEHAA
jgi:hypothetical protein